MAKGTVMLALEIEEFFSSEVTDVPPLIGLVFDTLDGDRTTIREISSQKIGAFFAKRSGAGDIAEGAFATLFLVFADRNRPLQRFYAPSHVPSPPIDGAGMAILEVRDFAFSAPEPIISLARQVSAHAYFDEIEGPLTLPPGGDVIGG